jgi:hypothetical protein
MKNIINSVIVFAVVLLSSQFVQAQGTMTYLSNVDQASTGGLAVGSDSWLAAGFQTGTNATGYTLDTIELGMADASGSPSDFTVALYKRFTGGFDIRGPILDTLEGSLNPTTAGIYTFTTDSNITLSANTQYVIMLSAGTAVANGAYDWSIANGSYDTSGNWSIAGIFSSSDGGSRWTGISGNAVQFSIEATPIPEPGVLALSGLGGLLLLWHRRKSRAVHSAGIAL